MMFKHGPHAGERVYDSVHELLNDDMETTDLTPMVAVQYHGQLYVVFGNRRLKALKEYAFTRG